MQGSFFTTSDKRCSKACICGNKPNQIKNIRSCFSLAVLIT
ncbi:alpha-mannosidase, partial [Enterococcus faecium]